MELTSAKKRVVVTGIGIVSPVGNNRESTWRAIVNGESGIRKITHFDTKDCTTQIAGEVKNFNPCFILETPLYPRGKKGEALIQPISQRDQKRMDRFIHLAVAASVEAYADSGIDHFRDQMDPEMVGVNIGVGMGGLPAMEEAHQTLLTKGFRRITPYFIPQVIANLAAGHVSIILNTQNINYCSVSACASSAHSIGESFRIIQRGDASVMIAGGTEAVVCALSIGGFAVMRALSTRNEMPEKASRPFDSDRDGFVLAEGAASLILEEYEFAKNRGAKIYAELCGYGASSDAFHITHPMEEGDGGYRAMKLALKESGLSPSDANYVNAHGTSTPLGDIQESKAIARLLWEAKNLHVSSTKSMTGHMLGAAGAVESAFSVLAIRDGIVPPTINLENIDPACADSGLNFTPNIAIRKKVELAMSNSFGFGGTNVSLAYRAL